MTRVAKLPSSSEPVCIYFNRIQSFTRSSDPCFPAPALPENAAIVQLVVPTHIRNELHLKIRTCLTGVSCFEVHVGAGVYVGWMLVGRALTGHL